MNNKGLPLDDTPLKYLYAGVGKPIKGLRVVYIIISKG